MLGQIFLEDPSPLSLLLLRFTVVSIGSSGSATVFSSFSLEPSPEGQVKRLSVCTDFWVLE